MRVLHGSSLLEYDYGGAEPVTRELIKLLGRRLECAAVCLAGGTQPCEGATVYRVQSPLRAGAPTAQLYKRYLLFLQNEPQLRAWRKQVERLVDVRSFDLLHCHDINWLGVFTRLARRYRKPLGVTCHLSLPSRLILSPALKPLSAAINLNLWRRDFYLRSALRQASWLAAPSEFCATSIRRFAGPGAPAIHVVLNWIDDYMLSQESAPPANSGNNIIYVGRLAQEKGVKMLLQCAARIPEAQFTFVGGNGPLQRVVSENRLVKWVPSVAHKELVPFIRNYRVAACPSLVDESFGKTALEHRVAGVKIVATRAGAIPEILAGYPNVFWCEKNARSLEEQLRTALAATPATEEPDARQKFLARFSPGPAIESYLRLYAAATRA